MRDKSLNIFLMVFFVISSAAILALAWLQPLVGSERVLTTIIGSVGLFVVFVRGLLLRFPDDVNSRQVMLEIEVKDKP
ncbi:hypothetical protein ACFLXD_04060 [Chloroflexota bacterium]